MVFMLMLLYTSCHFMMSYMHYWQGAVPGQGSIFYWQTVADQCYSKWTSLTTSIRSQEVQHAQAKPSHKLEVEMMANDVDSDMVD